MRNRYLIHSYSYLCCDCPIWIQGLCDPEIVAGFGKGERLQENMTITLRGLEETLAAQQLGVILSLLNEQHKGCSEPHNELGFGKTPGNTKGIQLVLGEGEQPSDNVTLRKSVVKLSRIRDAEGCEAGSRKQQVGKEGKKVN